MVTIRREQGRSWSSRLIRISASLAVIPMNDLRVSISPKQQEILLRGLRFVRSAVALDACDYTQEVDTDRKRQYAEIAELESLLNGGRVAELSGAR
jgi:hypothetical protein